MAPQRYRIVLSCLREGSGSACTVQHRMGFLGAIDVGMDAGCSESDVVGDEYTNALGEESESKS